MKTEKQEYSELYYKRNIEIRALQDPNFLTKNDFVLSFFSLDPNFFYVDDYLFLVENKNDVFIKPLSLDFISEKNSELMKQLFEFDKNERLTETSKNKIKAMKNI